MNEHHRLEPVPRDLGPRDLPWPETTQAAEGMPRRPWKRAEIIAMVEAGIIDEDERFELIGGELVPMSPKGARHEMVQAALNRYLQRIAPDDLTRVPETTLWLDENSFVEPDFCVFPSRIAPGDQRGYDVLLAVEIGDTSLAYDLGRKIGIYAVYGIAEVWVIDARRLATRVHRRLGAEGYAQILEAGPVETLSPLRVPALAVSLAGLGLSPLSDE